MGSEWPSVRLGDYVDSCLGKMLDKEKNRGDLYPYLGNKNVRWGSFDLDDLAEMRFEDHEHERYGLKYGDLVVCEGGEPGRCAIWKEQVPGMKIQKALHRIRPLDGLNNYYLNYWFMWAYRAGLLDPWFTGTTIKHLTGRAISQLEIPLPPIRIQEKISDILASLDDKIVLNYQTNNTLESMTQALFKSWFVDFDPVIDNALAAGNPIPEALQARADARAALGDRRKPLPDHIRQQFPDRFVLTEEMGWVPEGWKVTPLSEAIEINPKVTIKKGQKAKHVDMKALPTSGYCVGEISEKEYAGGAKFERGDVLLARITPCLENGKTGVVNFLSDGEPGFGSTEFIVMRPKNAIGTSFVAALARQEAFRQHCISNMVGSSGRQRVQNSCFDTYFICTPKVPDILDLYRDNCEAWFVKMTTLANESRSLGLLRDTLLPKLLSGELRIPEAEKQVEEII